MTYKITRKAIVNGSSNIVSVGYCDLSTLLRYHSPIAYTCGVYGWNFDVYEIHGLTICTGYRGMPGRAANNVHKYEQAARDALERLDWREEETEIERLLADFCAQA